VSELRDVIRNAVIDGGTWPRINREVDEVTDSVISAIGDSGRVVVDRARFERLLGFAAKQFSAEFTDMDEWRNWQNAGIQPGDLEPLP